MSTVTNEVQEARYWQAVVIRDSKSDGTFVFAVRSTGIYCRPSCPARRPKREQVVFFAQPDAAEQAGFRACQRCYPNEAGIYEQQCKLVQRVCRYIENHLDQTLTLADLGAEVSLSPYHLQRIFKRVMGISPRQYVEACRLEGVKAQLKGGETVTDALYDAGYSSSSRLYERAQAQLGMTPAVYRRNGQGMQICFTIAPCRLGLLLVGATQKGICAVYLGNSEEYLTASLKQEYSAANIERDTTGMNTWVSSILDYLNGQQPDLALPLDVQATAFQWQVWQALQAIPYGSTSTYSEIAQSIGNPKAARAVGHACATNPVSLVVPCHRAIREDGGLGGYRWGLERKQALINQEQGSKE